MGKEAKMTRVVQIEDVRVHGLYLWTPGSEEGVEETVMILDPKVITDTVTANGPAPCLNAVGLRHGFQMSIPLHEAGLAQSPVTRSARGSLEPRGTAGEAQVRSLTLAAHRTSNAYKWEVAREIAEFFLAETDNTMGAFVYGGLGVDKPRTKDIDFGLFVTPETFVRNLKAEDRGRFNFAITIKSARIHRVAPRLVDLFFMSKSQMDYLAFVLRGKVSKERLGTAYWQGDLGTTKGLVSKLDIALLPPLPMDLGKRALYNHESRRRGWDHTFLDRMATKMRLWNAGTGTFDELGQTRIDLGSPDNFAYDDFAP